MLSITSDMSTIKPDYVRVLGATEKGRKLITDIRKKSNLKIITKSADFKESNVLFEKDCLATDLWALSSENTDDRKAGMDFTTSPVFMKSHV